LLSYKKSSIGVLQNLQKISDFAGELNAIFKEEDVDGPGQDLWLSG
jgi:hypothetical protein